MTVFNGKNSLKSRELFESRKLFKIIYSDFLDLAAPSMFNSWYDNQFYGKTSQHGIPIIIKSESEPLYFTIDGKVWNGPVHMMEDNGIMTGRTHNEKSKSLIQKDISILHTVDADFPDVKALNFVVDAFQDFKEHIEDVARRTTVTHFPRPSDNKLLRMKPHSGWTDPRESYLNHMDKLYDYFINTYLKMDNKFKNIKNFDDFMNYLIEFTTEYGHKMPVTLTQYITSTLCSPKSSGLIIDLANEDQSDDQTKYEEYFKDPAFEFFKKNSAKFGFILSSNAPWRLYANLRSPKMQDYMRRRNVTFKIKKQISSPGPTPLYAIETDLYGRRSNGVNYSNPGTMYYRVGPNLDDRVLIKKDLFELYYKPSCFVGLDMLKTELWNFYNTFVTNSPYTNQVSISKSCTRTQNHTSPILKTKQTWNSRKTITKVQFYKQYKKEYWTSVYARIRMSEVGQSKNIKQMKKILNDVHVMNKKLDLEDLVMYIDNRARSFDGRYSKTTTLKNTKQSSTVTTTATDSPMSDTVGESTGY